jgi:hypothetical protein
MNQHTKRKERIVNVLTEIKMVRFMMNTNCLYLLSVCLMLIGTFLMMHSPVLSTNPLAKNIQIYAILQIYEILLITICVLLLKKQHLYEDGLILVGIEVLLFLDPTFFNNVFYTIDLTVGLMVNLACFVLLVIKYCILVRIGGLPHSRRVASMLIITALFVYFYPVFLSKSMTGALVDSFYYFCCWLPLLLATLMPSMDTLIKTGKTESSAHQKRAFFIAVFLIFNYIIISHLVESLIGYGLDFKMVYISPFLVASCFLFAKLRPKLLTSADGKQIVWVITVIAVLFSFIQDEGFTYRTLLNIWLSPFRYTLVSIIALNFLLWFRSRQKYYVFSLIAWGFLLFSGKSPGDILNHIVHFHQVPYFYLSGCLALLSWMRRKWFYLYLSGLPLFFLATTRLVTAGATAGYFVICQIMGLWSILVLWHYSHRKRLFLTFAILSFMLAYALMRSTLHEYAEYYTLYLWLFIIASCVVAFLTRSRALSIIALLGILGRIFYIAQEWLPGYVRSGMPVMILAFITLLLGLFTSLLKQRRISSSSPNGSNPGNSLT